MPQPHQQRYKADTLRLQLAALPVLRQIHDEHPELHGRPITAGSLNDRIFEKSGIEVQGNAASGLLAMLDPDSRRGGYIYLNTIPADTFDRLEARLRQRLDVLQHSPVITADRGYTSNPGQAPMTVKNISTDINAG